MKDLAQEALDLSRILGSFLHGRGPLIQGAALADVVSMYIAGHPPGREGTVLALPRSRQKTDPREQDQQIFPDSIRTNGEPGTQKTPRGRSRRALHRQRNFSVVERQVAWPQGGV